MGPRGRASGVGGLQREGVGSGALWGVVGGEGGTAYSGGSGGVAAGVAAGPEGTAQQGGGGESRGRARFFDQHWRLFEHNNTSATDVPALAILPLYLYILPACFLVGYCLSLVFFSFFFVASSRHIWAARAGGTFCVDALMYLPCSYALCVRIRPRTNGPGGP